MKVRLTTQQRQISRAILLLVAVTVSTVTNAQIGGKGSFRFLDVPVSARLAGIGGQNVSLADKDVNMFFSNPALNGDTLAGVAAVNYQFYIADVGHSAFAYAADLKRLGVITFGIQHMDYGSIESFDETGMAIGEFKANETAINISKSHEIRNYRLGATVRAVFSNLAGFRSSAVCLDAGGVFIHPKHDLTIGLAIKNAGFVLSDYSSTAESKLPFDVQVGTTFKPAHMPLRFSLTVYNLSSPDATYDDPVVEEDNSSTVKDVLNHVNVGTEVLLHRNVNVLLGYNFLNHQTLKLEEGGGGAGITLGLVVRIKKFELVMSRAAYVAGNAAYSFTLSGNLNKMIKKI